MNTLRSTLLVSLVALAAPAQAAISGRVLSADGRSLSGVALAAYAPENAFERSRRLAEGRARTPVASALTAADGTFRLQGPHAVVDLEARWSGFAPLVTRLVDGEDATLVLDPAVLRRGQVLAGGKPVAGATVLWMIGGGYGTQPHEIEFRTGADGSYEVPATGQWAGGVLVRHPDFAPLWESAGPEAAASPRHELERGVTIEGRVTDRATRRGVADATVVVDGWPLARSAADGSFRIPHAPRDWDGLRAATDALFGSARSTRGRIAIELEPMRRVSGVVTDAGSQRPLAGASVTLTGGAETLVATTDAAGRYSIAAPADRYMASVVRSGFAPLFEGEEGPLDEEAIDLRRAAAARRDFALTPLRRLAGRVVDEAQRPVAGAFVKLAGRKQARLYSFAMGGSTAWSGADGSFRLELPPQPEREENAEWTALALKRGYAMGVAEVPETGGARDPITIAIGAGVELAGRVTDPEGAPIAGASVVLAESVGFASPRLSLGRPGLAWTHTDAGGRFSTRVRASVHELVFEAQGRAPRTLRGHSPTPGTPLDVVLDPAAELRGRVVRPDGSGAAGLRVYAWNETSPGPSSATTADDGSFAVADLLPGLFQVQVMTDRQVLGETRTLEAPSSDVRLQIGATGRIEGRVIDAATGRPVDRFEVAVESADENAGQPQSFPAEDGDEAGRFSLGEVPAGNTALVVSAEGYVASRVEDVAVRDDGGVSEIEVLLTPGLHLRGRVSSEEGEPLADVYVRVDDRPGEIEPATTDARGEYDLAGLPAGSLEVSFWRQGYKQVKRQIEIVPGASADVTLSRGVSVSGSVTSEGKGVAKAQVSARSSVAGAGAGQAVTDRSGRFTITGLSAGRYTITANAEEGQEAKLEDVDVERAGALRLVLEARRTAVVHGRVVGLSAAGDEMVWVMAQGDRGGDRAQLDASGAFRMEKVPAGSVRVSAVVYTMSGTGRSSRVQKLEVLPGSEHEVQLEFVEGLAVSGMVSSDGVPAAGANVWFQSQEGNAAMSRTDGSGRYSVTGLEPGVYKVGASGINLSYEAEHTLTASGELDIDATGARLAGKVVDATSGSPIDAAEVSLWAVSGGETRPTTSVSTGSGGAFTVSSVAPGTYRVLASKDGYGQDVREIELQRSATSELAFELAPAEGLSVEVVDARDGRALDAVVVVRDASRNVIANRHSGVGDDGTLTIPLSPGRYLLSTSATGYATATLPVTAPGRGLRVPLTPGGTLVIESARELSGRVRLVRPDGEEYVRCWCNGIAGIELSGRRTTTENVAPGSYTVEVVDAAGKPVASPASVVIEEGRTASLQLQ